MVGSNYFLKVELKIKKTKKLQTLKGIWLQHTAGNFEKCNVFSHQRMIYRKSLKYSFINCIPSRLWNVIKRKNKKNDALYPLLKRQLAINHPEWGFYILIRTSSTINQKTSNNGIYTIRSFRIWKLFLYIFFLLLFFFIVVFILRIRLADFLYV